jgi:hypothetical protein
MKLTEESSSMVQPAIDPDGVAEPRASFDQTLASAVAALHRWRSWVSALPLMQARAGSQLTELRGLAAWYERMCADDCYANPPPTEALDVLDELERDGSETNLERLVVVRWAVRVAHELAQCRSLLANGGTDDVRAASIAAARLEVALNAAMEHMPNRRS